MCCYIAGGFRLVCLLFVLLSCFSEKMWKRVVNKVCFVGEDFTRKPPKFERYIRPTGLRFKKAHVTHPELKATFQLDIVGVKKNPQSQLYTSLGVITKGELGYGTLVLSLPMQQKVQVLGHVLVWLFLCF